MAFRFSRRYALFTYAQCGNLDPWEVSNLFSDLRAECIVGREEHSDGGLHLHAFVDFGRKYTTTDKRKFDVGGRHPNVLLCLRTPHKMWDYATKDGNVVAGGLERPAGGEVSQSSVEWDQIANAPNIDEFWDLLRELAPRSLLTSFNSLKSYAEWNYRPIRTPYSSPEGIEFDLSAAPGLSDWVQENVFGDPVSLIILHLRLLLPGGDPHRWGAPTPPPVALWCARTAVLAIPAGLKLSTHHLLPIDWEVTARIRITALICFR